MLDQPWLHSFLLQVAKQEEGKDSKHTGLSEAGEPGVSMPVRLEDVKG
jgi:hypothetical protein